MRERLARGGAAIGPLLTLLACPSFELRDVSFACGADEDCATDTHCDRATHHCLPGPVSLADGGVSSAPDAAAAPSWPTPELVGLALSSDGTEVRLYASGVVEAVPAGGTPTRVGVIDAARAERVVGIAFDAADRLHTWYRGGTHSVGTPQDLGAEIAFLPALGDAVGVDLDGSDTVYVFDRAGTTSTTTLDGGAPLSRPRNFASAIGKRPGDVAELAWQRDGRLRARYHDGTVSTGRADDLAAFDITPGAIAGMAMTLRETLVLYRSGYLKSYPGDLGEHIERQVGAWSGDWALSATGARRWSGAYVSLPDDVAADEVLGLSFDALTEMFLVWFQDGTWIETRGEVVDGVRLLRGPRRTSTATTAGLVDVGYASGDRVYRWYRDGRRSEGSTLVASSSVAASLPAGRRWDEVVAVDISWPSLSPAPGAQHTWVLFADGAISKGTTFSVGRYGTCRIDDAAPCALGP